MLIELQTTEGPVFVNPAFIALISEGPDGAAIMLASGDEFDVEGTVAEVVHAIQMAVF